MDPHRRRHPHQPPYEAPSGGRYVHSPLRSHPDSFDDRIHPSPLRNFFPLPAPPPPPPPLPQNPPTNHHADVHYHHFYQDPRRDDVRYYHPDKPHFPPETPCELRRLEPLEYIPHQPPNSRIPERASLPAPVRKRWPEPREVLPREVWRHDRADDGVRVRVYEDKRVPLGWEVAESAINAGRSHGVQSFQRDLHPRLLVESGGDPNAGRTRSRRDQIFALEDDGAFLRVEGYEGRGQRKAEFWDDGHGRLRSRDAPYEPEPSEIPALAPSRNSFPSDRYEGAPSFTFNKARSPPLNPGDSWVLPAKRVQPVPGAYGVDQDRGYWGNPSRGKEKRTVLYGREDRQDLIIPRKPSVLSRIQHSVPVWERLEEPNKLSSTIVRPERLEELEASTIVCPEMLEGHKLSSTIVHPRSPGFSDQEVMEDLPVSLDVSFKSNTLVAKEVLVSAAENERHSGERNDTLEIPRIPTDEPLVKSTASPQSNSRAIPGAGTPKKSLIKKNPAPAIQTEVSSKATVPTPKKKVVKGPAATKYLRSSERKVKSLVSTSEEVFSGDPKKIPSDTLGNQIFLKKDEGNKEISISPISDVTDPVEKSTNIPFEEDISNEQLSNHTLNPSKQILGSDMVSQFRSVNTTGKSQSNGLFQDLSLTADTGQPANSEMLVSPCFLDSNQLTMTPRVMETKEEDMLLCARSGKLNSDVKLATELQVEDVNSCSVPAPTSMADCPKIAAASSNLDEVVLDRSMMLPQEAASSQNKTSNLSLDADGSLRSSGKFLRDDVPETTMEGALVKDVNGNVMHDTNRNSIADKDNPLTGDVGNIKTVVKMQIKRKRKKAKVVNPNILVSTNPLTEEFTQIETSTSFDKDSFQSEAILVSPNNKRKRKKKRSNDCIVLVPSTLTKIKETSEGFQLEDGHDGHISVTSCQDFKHTNEDDDMAMLFGCDLDLKNSKMPGILSDNDPQISNSDRCSQLLIATDMELPKSATELSHSSLHVTSSNKIRKATGDAQKEHESILGKNAENPVCLDPGALQIHTCSTALNHSSGTVIPFVERHGKEMVAVQKIESPCSLKHDAANMLTHHMVLEMTRVSSGHPCSTNSSAHFQERFQNDYSVPPEYKGQKKSVENESSQQIFALQDEAISRPNDASGIAPGIAKISIVQDSVAPITEQTQGSVSAHASCSIFKKEHTNLNLEAEDVTLGSNYLRNCSESRPITSPVLESERESEPASKHLKGMPDMQGDPLNNDGPRSLHNISDEVSTKKSVDSNRFSASTPDLEIKPSETPLPAHLISEKKNSLVNKEAKTLMAENSNVNESSGKIRVSQKIGVPNAKHYQPPLPLAAAARVTPSPTPTQNMRHRTWHRADGPALQSVGQKKPQSKVSSLQTELPNKTERPLGSYVRKGNSLVRKSSAVPPKPSVDSRAFNEKFRLESAKSMANESSYVHLENVNLLKRTALMERPNTPPLPQMNKLINDPSNIPNHDRPVEVTFERTSYSNGKSPLDIDREIPGNFNLSSTTQLGTTKSKAVVYVKPKSNQLVAATEVENCKFSSHVPENAKAQPSSSDLFYMRKKNQLIRDTSAASCNLKQEGSASPDVSNQRAQTTAKYNNGFSNRSGYKGRTVKHSKSSRVWRLNATERSEKVGARSKQIEHITSILPWKRPTSQWISKSRDANKHSLALISRKLRLSRKRDTLYTVSKGGFSLRKSGVRGVGGRNLKWSKSMEKHSRKANEEATLAVVEAERKKRERKRASLLRIKGRKCLSRERVFRVGKVRYRMDSSNKTLVRIPDEDPSTSNNQSGRSILASRIPSRLLIGCDEYVRIGNGNKLVRDPKKLVRILASEKVRWSLHTARTRSTKKQQYCQFFTRFGKCNKMGKDCPYIHDPSKIAICTKYLKGVCSGVNCSLTHKIDPKMMPDCLYFLRGHCNKSTCPYRHVNVNSNATVCEGFKKGYCATGDECRKKHNFLCPMFEATGQCPQGSACKLHHPKHQNKSKKRKRSDMRRQNKWRYFVSSDTEATQPESVDVGRHRGSKESGDVYREGGTLEYMSLNFDSLGDSDEGLKTPQPYVVDLETDTSDAHQNSPDDLIKPVRIMKGKGLVVEDET